MSDKPAITTESDNLDPNFLDDLLLHIGSLASVYHKNPTAFISRYKHRYLMPSAALQKRPDQQYQAPQSQLQQLQPLIQQEQYQQAQNTSAQINDWGFNVAEDSARVFSTQSSNPYSMDLLQ